VFQINSESIKNSASNTELKKEIQNWVNKDITSFAGAGLTVLEVYRASLLVPLGPK